MGEILFCCKHSFFPHNETMFYIYVRPTWGTCTDYSLIALKKTAEDLREPYKIYDDVSSFNHKDLIQLLKEIKAGDYVGFWSYSSLSHDKEEMKEITATIKNKGAKIICIQDSQEYMEGFYQYVAKEGQKYLNIYRQQGDYESSHNIFGYTKKGYQKYVVNETEAKVIKYIFKEAEKGKAVSAIARDLEKKKFNGSKFPLLGSKVNNILKQPLYIGQYTKTNLHQLGVRNVYELDEETLKNELIKSNLYPQIINEELWWTVYRNYREKKTPS